jgi:hypothetical protein
MPNEVIDATNITQNILWGVGGLGALGVFGRMLITWLGRQGMISAGDNSQKELIERLDAEC